MADSSSRSPLRTAGIALLGVGIVAATVGLFTSVTNGTGTDGTAVPSASSQALPASEMPVVPTEAPAVPTSPAASAPAVPEVPPAAQPAPAQPAPAQPAPAQAAPAPAAPAPAPGGTDLARAPLRVYNNSLVQGLAAKAKTDFEAAGWTVTDISGYSEGNIPRSTAYFRPGTSEQAAAQELGREFGLQVEPRFAGLTDATPGVIVIVTQDYKPAGKR